MVGLPYASRATQQVRTKKRPGDLSGNTRRPRRAQAPCTRRRLLRPGVHRPRPVRIRGRAGPALRTTTEAARRATHDRLTGAKTLSLIHISEPTRQAEISYA